MTKRSFSPSAANVKMVRTGTIANTWAQGDTVTLTINNVDVVITIGTLVTTAQVATTIKEAFNGETLTDTDASYTPSGGIQSVAQFAEIVASVVGSVVSFTSRTAGNPFTMTGTESTAGDGTITMATATAGTGQSFFSQQDNWTGNTVPVDADDITFENSDVDCSDDLSPAIQPGTFEHYMSYTGYIGRTQSNERNASLIYPEYRTPALTFNDNAGATGVYKLGLGSGGGARGIRLDFGDGLSQITVYKSKAANKGIPNILLRATGSNANNTLTNLGGSVGVSFYAGEAMTLVSLTNGQGEFGNAETYCGPDATLTSCVANIISGKLTTNSAIATVNVLGGEYHHQKGNITALNLYEGRVNIYVACTITGAYIDGILDLSFASGDITFTDCEFGPNADVRASAGNIQFTNPYTQGEYSASRKLNLGPNRTFAVT